MQYLTYEEFKNIGGMGDLTAYNRSIVRACSVIDNATQNRIEAMKKVPQQAKELCRDLIDFYNNHSQVEKGISSTSQSAGGVSESVTYSQSGHEVIEDLVNDYLSSVVDDNGTPLLYRGAMI